MKIRKRALSVFCFFVILGIVKATWAIQGPLALTGDYFYITDPLIMDFSSQSASSGQGAASNVFNVLGSNGLPETYDDNPVALQWVVGEEPSKWISFDFGTATAISGFSFVQRAGASVTWGVHTIDLIFSDDASFIDRPDDTINMTMADGYYTGTLILFPTVTARYLKCQFINASNYTGASDMAFVGLPLPVYTATNPTPVNETNNVNLKAFLSWQPSGYAAVVNGQDVYLGTDFNNVNNATSSLDLGVYKGRQSSSSCVFALQPATTYYWRIDEVNNTNVWKGQIWSFRTIEGIVSQSNYNYYVATNGNDNNPGTFEQPFATIAKARDTLRNRGTLFGGTTVWIRGGTYYLNSPLVFGPTDSGTPTQTITYEAYPGENPVISGGKVINGWTSIGNDKWTVQIPEVAAGTWCFRQLWCDGQRCQRARWPNPDAAMLRVLSKSADGRTLTTDQTILGTGLSTSKTELIMYHYWSACCAAVTSKSGTTVTTATVCGVNDEGSLDPGQNNKPAYLENNASYIDQPQEWSLNTSGLLTYKSLAGVNPNNSTFIAPKLEKLLVMQGMSDSPVHDLIFRGLSFKHTLFNLPSFGFIDYQAGNFYNGGIAYNLPNVIHLFNAVDCVIERCYIANTGGSGVGLGEGCKDNILFDCKLYDIGGTGILTSARANVDTDAITMWSEAAAPNNNFVSNNYLQNIATEWFGCTGIYEAFSKNTHIINNTLTNLPYSAISVGIACIPDETPQEKATVAKNHIKNIMLKLHDGGGIYTIGRQRSAVITDNWIHDVGTGWWSALLNQNNGIFIDGYSADIYIGDNVTYGVPLGGQNLATGEYDIRLQTLEGFEPIRITFGTNYWNNPATTGTAKTIVDQAGVMPGIPTSNITRSSDCSNIIVVGYCEPWAQITNAILKEENIDVTSFLVKEENGAIHGIIPISLISSKLVTLQMTVSDSGNHISLPGFSNTISIAASDINCDGKVNFEDLVQIIVHWLESGSGITGDVNDDDKVNFEDFAELTENWFL